MLSVLSPAKSLDFDSPLPTAEHTTPRLLEQSVELIDVMRTISPGDLARLMRISEDLAHLNVTRYREFSPEHTPATSRPAVLAFSGDVYQGLVASTFGKRDFTEAQKTVRILSGLYGLLRPLDLIQPYRLEMGTRLVTGRGRSLYDWWGTRITDLLREDLAASPGPEVLVNLASRSTSPPSTPIASASASSHPGSRTATRMASLASSASTPNGPAARWPDGWSATGSAPSPSSATSPRTATTTTRTAPPRTSRFSCAELPCWIAFILRA